MQPFMNRREMLKRSGLGCGTLALHGLMAESAPAASRPHFPATAKNVIWLFMHGGPLLLACAKFLVERKKTPANEN